MENKSLDIQSNLISGGCNPIYFCMDMYEDALIYGCSSQVFIYSFSAQKVLLTLKGHTKRLNQCKFIKNNDDYSIISTSADGQLILWTTNEKNIYSKKYFATSTLKHFSQLFLEYAPLAQNNSLILTGDTEGNIYFIQCLKNQLFQCEKIQFPQSHIIQSASLQQITPTLILAALGSLDFQTHIYLIDISNLNHEGKGLQLNYSISLKGHVNALSVLKFKAFKDSNQNDYYILSTGSKDSYIRLYKIQHKQFAKNSQFDTKTLLNINQDYQIILESVLQGHQNPISQLDWGKQNPNSNLLHEDDVYLLSASLDFTLTFWAKQENIWMNVYKLGQMYGNKQAFFNGLFSPDYSKIVVYNFTGSFLVWNKEEKEVFTPQATPSGHFSYVTDLDWSQHNQFLVSCSQDQTTRIYAENQKTNNWHEFSRAQIHGYDINSVKLLGLNSPDKTKQLCDIIVCAGDEKVIRLFEPPANFINFMNLLSKSSLRLYIPDEQEENKYLIKSQLQKGIIQYETMKEGGAQVLGLMTKQIQIKKENFAGYLDGEEKEEVLEENEEELELKEEKLMNSNILYDTPPTEDYLTKQTLWPELNKLYGHGYELSCVTCNHQNTLIASTCKSQVKEQSCIILWNPKTYHIIDKIFFHNFTVSQLEFSHNDLYLCSVSRDRQMALFKMNSNTQKYEIFFSEQSHSRIIWTLSFSHDDKFLITGSRDKKIKIYSINQSENQEQESVQRIFEQQFKFPVTAVAFGDKFGSDNSYILSIGLENGDIQIFSFNNNQLHLLGQIPDYYAHSDLIKRIKFRKTKDNNNQFQFASCSNDHSVRIFSFNV